MLDYPRMMFHRTKEPVIVQSRAEEEALGKEWSRKVWPAEAAPDPAPAAPEPAPESEPEPEAEEELENQTSTLPRRKQLPKRRK